RRPWALLIIGILTASTSERSIIMMFAGTVAVYALFGWRRKWSRLDLLPLVLVVVLAAYAYVYMHFLMDNIWYDSFMSVGGTINFLKTIGLNSDAASAA